MNGDGIMEANQRISAVLGLKVNFVLHSSVIIIEDNLVIDPRTKAIAVQREVADFLGNEGNFNTETVFSRPFPSIDSESDVQLTIRNESPWIKTGTGRRELCELTVYRLPPSYRSDPHLSLMRNPVSSCSGNCCPLMCPNIPPTRKRYEKHSLSPLRQRQKQ